MIHVDPPVTRTVSPPPERTDDAAVSAAPDAATTAGPRAANGARIDERHPSGALHDERPQTGEMLNGAMRHADSGNGMLAAPSHPNGGPPNGMHGGPAGPGAGACTAPQLRRFIKSRPYVPMHELRRRFGIDGGEDDVTPVGLPSGTIYIGLPGREGALLGELLRGGEIGYELSMDPRSPIVVGLYPMRPVPRS